MGKWMMTAALAALAGGAAGKRGARRSSGAAHPRTQFGIGAMAMIIMQKETETLERRLAAAGLPNAKVSWRQFPGGNPMNDECCCSRQTSISCRGERPSSLRCGPKRRGPRRRCAPRRRHLGIAVVVLYDPQPERQEARGLEQPRTSIALTTVEDVGARDPVADGRGEDSGSRAVQPMRCPDGRHSARRCGGCPHLRRARDQPNRFSAPPFQYVEAKASGVPAHDHPHRRSSAPGRPATWSPTRPRDSATRQSEALCGVRCRLARDDRLRRPRNPRAATKGLPRRVRRRNRSPWTKPSRW